MATTPPTELEQRISDAADRVIAEGKTGYNWAPVDELLQQAVDLDGETRCKRANSSGRAANVLTESNDKDIALYLLFAQAPYTREAFARASEKRIRRFRNVRAVAIADRLTGTWRVRSYLEREGTGLVDKIKAAFPLVDDTEISIVPDTFAEEEEVVLDTPTGDEDAFATFAGEYPCDTSALADLPARFREFASKMGLDVDRSTVIDALACTLGSQLVLFAGPSGTGKSRLARCLAAFFSPPDALVVIEARRQMLGPEDVAGYYSNIGAQFALTSDTLELLSLHELCLAASGGATAAAVPFLLVEEANLSPIEGYLAPGIHGLSSPSSPYLRWPLHAHAGSVENEDLDLLIPPTLLFGPFPRLFGTINVDATAPAPARKIGARGLVVLLEPQQQLDAGAVAKRLSEDVVEAVGDSDDIARTRIGDPDCARNALAESDLTALLESFLGLVEPTVGHGALSHRDIARAANYMAWFWLLAQNDRSGLGEDGVRRLAAENALLHAVLPTLSSTSFARAMTKLRDNDPEAATGAASPNELGGLLAGRVDRLDAAVRNSMFPDAVDFWAALS
jgi:hypothetical protein